MYPTLTLAPGRQKRLSTGHPWVYATEIASVDPRIEPGSIVDVVDFRGRFIGRGYYNPRSQIAVRLLTRKDETIDREFFRQKLLYCLKHRQKVMPEATSYRLVFGEADFLPGLIIDKFEDYLVMQVLTLGMEKQKQLLTELLVELLQPRAIYERNDVNVRELEGLAQVKGVLYGEFQPEVIIKENGLSFLVDMENGQKTGYFLDQKENRAAIAPYVKDRTVLDCFCHTGSFTVHAAHYGARSVLALDISEHAIATARRNASLNGLENSCSFQVGNAFDVLREMDREKRRFDVIILDPPAFTKSKQTLEGAVRGYKEINLRAMKLLPPSGILITCSCSYHMQEDLFLEVIESAALDVGRQVRLLELRRQSKDHPILLAAKETYYLKFLILEIL
ncbi:class I SAM-dependent rRNA methyltransferase [Carboxydocella sp. ULO1]|uniref:class I SAM-dependent rRNA methyltransferase n=1 Tax=Carboxydocella sp. ULO1 TaxID=1926599 RepID=UPI0009ADA550|nr:class I SAM-dependent rRNA methyltransferase [Carboxydocella sp. ULO1]GAW29983.1 SAM-dependent methyltransferase [Carboxydocella sp. ULO1]